MRLIDIEPLQKERWNLHRYVSGVYEARVEVMELEKVPTVDAVPVKHGRWEREDNVYDDLTYICSACHEPWTLIDGTPLDNNMYYCPNCGAKMDLEGLDAKKET